MGRPTIKRIAELAGVSKSAVSYALNDRPGVSAATRARILAVANELAWRPSKTARSLVGGRAGAIGMVMNRPPRLLGLEPFYMEFVSGAVEVLASRDVFLAFRVATSLEEEIATYRAWASSKVVDGVLLTDLVDDDPRPGLVREVHLRAVVVGPQPDDQSVALWTADGDAMREMVRYLVALGHKVIARVAGTASYLHIETRTAAMRDEMARFGLEPPAILNTDFSHEQGRQATRRLLSLPVRPTAIIYDNDVMAVVGLAVAAEMGVDVPADVSMVAWDNSLLSQLSRPPLTSTSIQVHEYSAAVVEALLALIDGEEPGSRQFGEVGLAVRGSTSRPRSAGA
ncbi:MAG: LacI family transcriptional regulator [Bifidobacteriaceae bacterium]|nr:LacI family transcriptional regulator [Bifidobacteriaceae bacterium]